MKKLSSKNVLFAIFAALSVFAIGSCIAPVGSLSAFFDDPVVKDYIEEYVTAKVKLSDDSDEGLIPGNERIEGLDPEKYYMVEKVVAKDAKEGEEEPGYPKYVTDYPDLGPGGLNDFDMITRISGGAITHESLTNFYTYTVKSAKPLPSVTLSFNDGTAKTINADADGKVTISNPDGACTLTLSSVISGASIQYIAIPVPDAHPRTTPYNYNPTALTTPFIQAQGSTVDYVFSDGTSSNFKVLQVVVETKKQEVYLGAGSEGTAGNGQITGLENDKYYMVGITDITGGGSYTIGTYYATTRAGFAPLSNTLGDITRINGTITGLTNFNTYTVRSATALTTGTLSYTDNGNPETIAVNANGLVDIPSVNGTCILTLNSLATTIGGTNIQYIAVPVTPATRTDYTTKTLNVNPTVTQGPNTTVDYVFAEVGNPSNFKVLTVRVGGENNGNIQINITYTLDNRTITFTDPIPDVIQYIGFGTAIPVVFTLTPPAGTIANIQWRYNNVVVSTGNNVIVNGATASHISLQTLPVGTHEFAVSLTVNGIPYQGEFTFTVVP